MEALNPNDIINLDFDTISFITLKNGDMIVIDSSVPQKYQTSYHKYINNYDYNKYKTYSQKLSVSKQLNFFYKNKNNFIINNNNQITIKNDFNLISRITKNISFYFKGSSDIKTINNIQNISIKENSKKNSFFEKKFDNQNNRENLNNNQETNTILSINQNINKNTINKINNSSNQSNQIITINRNNIKNLNIKTEEKTEEEKLDMRIKRKSRNYLERLSLVFSEKNKPLVNAVISLKIPSDVNRELSATEKEFDMMVSQLKQKRSKYQIKTNSNIFHKYYEFYKDNNKEYKYVNLNRIKYYQESEKEYKENEQQLNNNENNTNIKLDNNNNITTFNNTFYGSFNNKGMNKSMVGLNENNIINKTTNSFYFDSTKTSKQNKVFSSRIKDLGYNSTLVCPTNNFKGNLDSDF